MFPFLTLAALVAALSFAAVAASAQMSAPDPPD